MQIEYENTMEDVVAFNMFHYDHSPVHRRNRLIQQFLFPLLTSSPVAILSLFSGENWAYVLPMWILWAVVSLGWVLLYPPYLRWIVKRRIPAAYREGSNRNTIGKHVMVLTPEELIDSTDVNRTAYKWIGVNKIVTDDRYIYLYVASLSAFIVPKRAFPDETSVRDFMETAERFRSAAVA
jgi:hypothetical protein